jgi:hypothetical protein
VNVEEPESSIDQVPRQIADRAAWPPPRSPELEELLVKGVLVYGLLSDATHIQKLAAFYQYCIEHLEFDIRAGIYRYLYKTVEDGKTSTNTLMPFLFVETEPTLVAEAVIDFCTIAKAHPDDALSRCRDVCRWISEDRAANRAGMFGGLVCLGDARVMKLLDELKWTLTEDEVGVVARSASTTPTIACVEFWLSWIEEIVYRRPERASLLGHVASGLAILERRRGIKVYPAVERNFGHAAPIEGCAAKFGLRVLEELTPREVAARYAERMYALEAAEPAPKLMSMVLVCFGLEPKAPVSERYVIQ